MDVDDDTRSHARNGLLGAKNDMKVQKPEKKTWDKKRKIKTADEALARPWCYYCERDFDDLKILISHQKAKHFKCNQCNRRLNTAGGLGVHLQQVHKSTLNGVENSIPGRGEQPGIEIFGMEGIPDDIKQQHNQRVLRLFYEADAERYAATGNPGPGQTPKPPKHKKPPKDLDVKARLRVWLAEGEEGIKRLDEERERKAKAQDDDKMDVDGAPAEGTAGQDPPHLASNAAPGVPFPASPFGAPPSMPGFPGAPGQPPFPQNSGSPFAPGQPPAGFAPGLPFSPPPPGGQLPFPPQMAGIPGQSAQFPPVPDSAPTNDPRRRPTHHSKPEPAEPLVTNADIDALLEQGKADAEERTSTAANKATTEAKKDKKASKLIYSNSDTASEEKMAGKASFSFERTGDEQETVLDTAEGNALTTGAVTGPDDVMDAQG